MATTANTRAMVRRAETRTGLALPHFLNTPPEENYLDTKIALVFHTKE
jgi:hypothetical protein